MPPERPSPDDSTKEIAPRPAAAPFGAGAGRPGKRRGVSPDVETDPEAEQTIDAEAETGGDTIADEAESRQTIKSDKVPVPRPGSGERPRGEPAGPIPTRIFETEGSLAPSLSPEDATAIASGVKTPPSRKLEAFGPYTILKEIGRGGMGVVYKARQKALHRDVALKVMLAGQFASEVETRRFLREAEACALLKHPHIVPVHDIGVIDGKYYFTMDFVEGITLREWVKRPPGSGRRSDREVLELMAKVCDAIHYAHQRGIIHRDLKPANIMVDAAGEPHVMDFGLAKRVGGESARGAKDAGERSIPTLAGTVMGTPHYMPPEQAAGAVDEIDNRCDVYALGVMLYELLTGHLPLEAKSLNELLEMIESVEPPKLRTWRPDLSWELEVIVHKAMAKEKSQRFQTARELGEDVLRFLANQPIRARRSSVFYRSRKFVERHRTLSTAVAVALTVASVGGVLWYRELDEQRRRNREAAAAAAVEARGHLAQARTAARSAEEQVEILERAQEAVKRAAGLDPENREIVALGGDVREALSDARNARKEEAKNQARAEALAKAAEMVAEARALLEPVRPEAIGDLAAIDAALRRVADARERLFAAYAIDALETTKAELDRADEKRRALDAARPVLERREGREKALAEARRALAEARELARGEALARTEADADRLAQTFERAAGQFELAYALSDRTDDDARQGAAVAILENAAERLEAKKFEIARVLGRAAAPYDPDLSAGFLERVKAAELAETEFHRDLDAARRAFLDRDFAAAHGGFRKALDAAPGHPDALFGLRLAEAGLACKAGKHEEERRLLIAADDLDNSPNEAEDVARELARCHGELADAALVEARAARDARQYDRALELCAAALEYRRNDDEARRLRAEIEARKKVPAGMQPIDASAFPCGPPGAEKETHVEQFSIGRTEVTVADFARFVEAGGYANPALWDEAARPLLATFVDRSGLPGPRSFFRGKPSGDTGDLPVTGVSWYEARAYARWKDGARLPREKEWEKAATWDLRRKLKIEAPWIGRDDRGAATSAWEAWLAYFDAPGPRAVDQAGMKVEALVLRDESPAGVLGMYGNVHEWTIADGDELGGLLPGGLAPVRGGSFESRFEERARATRRFLARPELRADHVGFRLAKDGGAGPP